MASFSSSSSSEDDDNITTWEAIRSRVDETTMSRVQEACLRRILRQRFPRDVPMPCRKGSKAPLFSHAHGCWTWERYEDFLLESDAQRKKEKNQDLDLCVVLSDLCVVDVDGGPAAVARFERENADYLRGAPRVDTAHGRHYWFVRPAAADDLGYFDGPAQRQRGIDFKSVCRTGTGGVVCVPPSTGKTWVGGQACPRHPYAATMAVVLNGGNVPEMPLALLDRVARPRHLVPTSRELTLAFCSENDVGKTTTRTERTVRAGKHIQGTAYFEPFLAAAAADEGEEEDNNKAAADDAAGAFAASSIIIPVPCRAELFFELLHVIDRRELSGKLPPSHDLLRELARDARLLGCPHQEGVVRDLAVGVPQAQAAVVDMFPEWWAAHVRERAELDADLIDLDLDPSCCTSYSPTEPPAHRRDERLLPMIYARAPERRPHGMAAGDRLLPRQGAAHDALLHGGRRVDARVLAAMRAVPGHVVLAGGAVLDGLMGGRNAPDLPRAGDYDLFLVGLEDDAACCAALRKVGEALVGDDGSNDVYSGWKMRRRSAVHPSMRFKEPGGGGWQQGTRTTTNYAARTGCSHTFVLAGAAREGSPARKRRRREGNHASDVSPSPPIIVQVVLKKYARIAQVLSSFDVGPCKVAAVWRAEEEGLRVLCAPTWLPCMRRMAFPVDLGRWGSASPLRLFKYLCRGFEVYLPGVSREAAERALARQRATERDRGTEARSVVSRRSILEVLRVERNLGPVLRADAGVDIVTEPAWPDLGRVKDVLSTDYLNSDYEATASTSGRLVYIVAEMLRNGYRWPNDQPVSSLATPTTTTTPHDAVDDHQRDRDAELAGYSAPLYSWPAYSPLHPIMRPAPSLWHLVAASNRNVVEYGLI